MLKIEDMNISKEKKEKYLLKINETYNKINSTLDKILLNPNERRKKLNKKDQKKVKRNFYQEKKKE